MSWKEIYEAAKNGDLEKIDNVAEKLEKAQIPVTKIEPTTIDVKAERIKNDSPQLPPIKSK
jgi:hypothetical protein